MSNKELYEKALAAVTELFNDKSVTQAECKSRMGDLLEEIDNLLDTLTDDEEEC